ncbi:protein MIZU-KUSSEI 1-like [Cocos nucifera]|uniref:Protein MIZU-KUSSEI 1-like n=1 Tax=Cocos nucifera TaxID=13894 RepID=A0A8K0IXL0_COCNU|nr:protein MIZU-KUSSEI 1-like [Cocos nucifera]
MTQPRQSRTPTAAESRSPSPSPSPPTSAGAGDPIHSPPRVPITLLQPSQRKHQSRPAKLFRTVRSAFRSFPILTPVTCRLPHVALHRSGGGPRDGHIHGAIRTTGTLFGHFKARINLAIQDNPRSVPILLLELAVPTAKFLQDMRSTGHLRVALECEKKAADKTPLLEEPMWTAFINSKNIGYAARREPTDSDLHVMQLLHAISMGAGVLPGDMTDPVDGELTYMRAHFDRVVGSKDSETFYMLNPDEKTSSELSIFFVRI